MTFFFLPKQHPQTLESLPDGRFCTNECSRSYIVEVPHGCAPVWCEYTGNWTKEDHSWTNPISGQVHTTHPLDFQRKSCLFFDNFVEITQIKGLTFGEGEAWCPDTNQKIHIEKTDQMSIWNPFFQRYDEPCPKNNSECVRNRIHYDFVEHNIHEMFKDNMSLFFKVYCPCSRWIHCKDFHLETCKEMYGLWLKLSWWHVSIKGNFIKSS